MFDSERVKQDFSKAAPYYDKNANLQQRVLFNLAGKVKPFLGAKTQILDVGCGTGQLSRLITGDITQLDLSYPMCKIATHMNPVINANAETLPFANGSFDIVLSSLVFQWVNDRKAAMDEMKRVLRPGGIIAISTFAQGTLRE